MWKNKTSKSDYGYLPIESISVMPVYSMIQNICKKLKGKFPHKFRHEPGISINIFRQQCRMYHFKAKPKFSLIRSKIMQTIVAIILNSLFIYLSSAICDDTTRTD